MSVNELHRSLIRAGYNQWTVMTIQKRYQRWKRRENYHYIVALPMCSIQKITICTYTMAHTHLLVIYNNAQIIFFNICGKCCLCWCLSYGVGVGPPLAWRDWVHHDFNKTRSNVSIQNGYGYSITRVRAQGRLNIDLMKDTHPIFCPWGKQFVGRLF